MAELLDTSFIIQEVSNSYKERVLLCLVILNKLIKDQY